MAPKKKGKKKKGGKKKKKMIGNEAPGDVMKRLLKTYERNCQQSNTTACPGLRRAMRDAMEEDDLLGKFIIDPAPITSTEDVMVSLEPLLHAMRQERYVYAKSLHIWDLPIPHHHMATLGLLLEKGVYPVENIEMLDCLIQAPSLQRLSLSFNACASLSRVVFDYNEFGDAGCVGLCEGLEHNRTITCLSLNYCDLGIPSGKILGKIVASTAISELYLDGNDLQCEGAVELIKMFVDKAEEEGFEREENARLKLEEEALEAERQKDNRHRPQTSGSERDDKESRPGSTTSKGKKKKKAKKKKSKGPPPPPRVGPWISKLHLADNGIDALGLSGQLAPLLCMRLFRRLIVNSENLTELDLDDNLIGDLGGKEMMEALQDRKDADLGGLKLRTTHRMDAETFANIVKLGAGLKQKKKKKGKKKKK